MPIPSDTSNERSEKVLANVTVALAAMGVGALGLPLDLSNLLGGLMVLLLAAFGRFLLNGTRIPLGERGGGGRVAAALIG